MRKSVWVCLSGGWVFKRAILWKQSWPSDTCGVNQRFTNSSPLYTFNSPLPWSVGNYAFAYVCVFASPITSCYISQNENISQNSQNLINGYTSTTLEFKMVSTCKGRNSTLIIEGSESLCKKMFCLINESLNLFNAKDLLSEISVFLFSVPSFCAHLKKICSLAFMLEIKNNFDPNCPTYSFFFHQKPLLLLKTASRSFVSEHVSDSAVFLQV